MVPWMFAAALAADWTPTAGQEELARALSVRDAPPPCAELEAQAQDPLADLLAVVEHVQMPPWVSVRAATCVASRHAEAAEASLLRWVTDPDLRGLGLVTLNLLDDIPEPVAARVAAAALAGPSAEDARVRVARATTPAVRALVP
jgi:hypothetical protein